MRKLMRNLVKDESGATAIEYGLIAGLLSVVIITTVATVGVDLSGTFQIVASVLQ